MKTCFNLCNLSCDWPDLYFVLWSFILCLVVEWFSIKLNCVWVVDIGWLKRISADSCKRASLEIYRSRSIYQFYRQITIIASKLTNYILSGWDSKVAGLHAYLISLILLSFVFQVEKTSCSLLFMRKSWCLAALRCRETLSRLCGWSKLPLSKRPQLLQLLESTTKKSPECHFFVQSNTAMQVVS